MPVREQVKPNLYTDSFCERLAWIQRNSQGVGLEKLDRYHRNELLKAINNAREVENPGFTEFEIEILVLVVSYCCYFIQNWSSPFQKFEKFKKPERYYSEMRKLVALQKKIRYKDARLSSLIKDACISELVKKIEQYDG